MTDFNTVTIKPNILNILHTSYSWREFKSNISSHDNKFVGDCFEALTKSYLELDPKYVTEIKQVWYVRDVPPHVQAHLNLPATDEGIDLIA